VLCSRVEFATLGYIPHNREGGERGLGLQRGQMGMARAVLRCSRHLCARGRCFVWDHICFELTAVSCLRELEKAGLA